MFLRLGHEPVVLPISGTHKAGMVPAQSYRPLTRLGAKEYIDTTKSALVELSGGSRAGPRTRGRPLVLLHDREPSHKAKLFCDWAAAEGLQVVLLPAHCPDLTPLDATFFGTVMVRWRKRCIEANLAWNERAALFVRLLKEQSCEAHIMHWRRALEACISELGGHVEHSVRKRVHQHRG